MRVEIRVNPFAVSYSIFLGSDLKGVDEFHIVMPDK